MAIKVTFNVDDDQLRRRLKQLPVDLKKKYLERAVLQAAMHVGRQASINAPRATGSLASGVFVTPAKRRSKNVAAANVRAAHNARDYGSFVELGTRQRFADGESRGRIDVQATRFLRPALYDNAIVIWSILRNTMRRFIRSGGK